MIPSRSKLHFNVAPGDRQVWAIGMVTIQWTLIEMWINVYGHGLCEISGDKQAKEKFDQTRAFDIRLDQVEALAELYLQKPAWLTLKALFVRVKDAKFMRDRVVHGTWGGMPRGPGQYEQLATHNWFKPHQPFDWKLDYGGLIRVVRTIDNLAHDFFVFFLNNSGDKTQHATLQDALRRIWRTPDPT